MRPEAWGGSRVSLPPGGKAGRLPPSSALPSQTFPSLSPRCFPPIFGGESGQ